MWSTPWSITPPRVRAKSTCSRLSRPKPGKMRTPRVSSRPRISSRWSPLSSSFFVARTSVPMRSVRAAVAKVIGGRRAGGGPMSWSFSRGKGRGVHDLELGVGGQPYAVGHGREAGVAAHHEGQFQELWPVEVAGQNRPRDRSDAVLAQDLVGRLHDRPLRLGPKGRFGALGNGVQLLGGDSGVGGDADVLLPLVLGSGHPGHP